MEKEFAISTHWWEEEKVERFLGNIREDSTDAARKEPLHTVEEIPD